MGREIFLQFFHTAMSHKTISCATLGPMASIAFKLQQLADELGHEPTWQEIDSCHYLPSVRHIQRAHGGLKKIRNDANFSSSDHSKGYIRSRGAKKFHKRGKEYEKKLLTELRSRFSFADVREQYPLYGDNRCATDVAVFFNDKKHVDLYDIFYPSDLHSLKGCVRTKINTYKGASLGEAFLEGWTYNLILVSGNKNISQEDIDTYMQSRTTPTPSFITVHNYYNLLKK